jgi:NodT family efflux transporter outer membrane factor (OMF) lipoprotein
MLGGLIPGGGKLAVPPITDNFAGFDASWELDLWGRVRRQVEAADAQVETAADQRRDVLVTVLAEVARDYIQLRGVQVQIGIAQDNLKIAEQVRQLAQERQRKGLQSALDTQNALAQIEGLRAQIPALQQQESELVNALCYLLDQPPGALREKLGSTRKNPLASPNPPLGIASDLARRRPDIRAAEAQLHAATAETGVAVASFYPTIQLNGTVGYDALDLSNMWKGSSLQYQFGPSISLPLFNAGRLQNTLELRQAQQQEAAILYHKTVLRAWHDVVNALVAIRQEQARHARLAAQLGHARQASSIARARYADGVAEFISVLDAERTALLAEQQMAQSATTMALDEVQLFKALGGGWEQTFPVAEAK